MKILIADDHDIVRKELTGLLQEEFFSAEIHEVTNGTDAIDMVRKNTWDLILLDISMPFKNGIDTLKQIRAEGITTPVLIVSMQPSEQYALRLLNAGASGYLNKESITDALIAAVHRVLSGRKYISQAH
ncbi:MAG: response regulator transcription factor [Bacteroidota bacterium]|nr:response regulator transcription factor [Bacteroidota bacterium]